MSRLSFLFDNSTDPLVPDGTRRSCAKLRGQKTRSRGAKEERRRGGRRETIERRSQRKMSGRRGAGREDIPPTSLILRCCSLILECILSVSLKRASIKCHTHSGESVKQRSSSSRQFLSHVHFPSGFLHSNSSLRFSLGPHPDLSNPSREYKHPGLGQQAYLPIDRERVLPWIIAISILGWLERRHCGMDRHHTLKESTLIGECLTPATLHEPRSAILGPGSFVL